MPALPFIQLSLPVESLLRFNLSELELHVKTVILITCKNSKEVDHSDISEIFLKNEIKIIIIEGYHHLQHKIAIFFKALYKLFF